MATYATAAPIAVARAGRATTRAAAGASASQPRPTGRGPERATRTRARAAAATSTPTAGSEVLGRVAIRANKHRRPRLANRRVNDPRSMENPATVARRLLCIYQHAPTPGAPGIYRHRLYLAQLVRRGWHVDLISPINYM